MILMELTYNILCSYTAGPQSIIGSIFGEAQGKVRSNTRTLFLIITFSIQQVIIIK